MTFHPPTRASAIRADRAFRGDIEGLRAVAILLVVLYHAGWSAMPAGYFGVDVFFVLSGYLITGILVREIASTGDLSLVNFWARRARRLLPAATVVVITVLVIDAVVVSPFEQIVYAHSARAFAVYASNVLFAWRGVNYFAPDLARNPFVHTWSLSVEEQYYLVFAPCLLLLVRRHVLARDVPIRHRLNWIVAVLSCVSFVGCLASMRWNSVIAFYSLPSRAWEFGLGAFIAVNATPEAVTSSTAASDWRRDAASIAALVGLVLVCAMAGDASAHPGWVTLLPAGLTAVLVATGRNGAATVVARRLSAPPLRLIGRLSYSWYLWHWPMLIWLGSAVPNPSLGLRLSCAFGALVPAAITNRWIESPIRFSRRLQRLPGQTIAAALVVAAVTLAASELAARHARHTLRDPRLAAAVDAATTLAPVFTDGCNLDIKVIILPPCTFGNSASDTTVFLFGDSHAAQWFPALLKIATSRGWQIVSRTKSACPAASITVISRALGRPYSECDRWRESVFREIAGAHPQLVMVANYGSRYELVTSRGRIDMSVGAHADTSWALALEATIRAIVADGSKVVVLQDTPHPGLSAPDCIARNHGNADQCVYRASEAVDMTLSHVESRAARDVNGAGFLTTIDLFCSGAICPTEEGGIVRFQDDHHISVNFAEALSGRLEARLDTLLR